MANDSVRLGLIGAGRNTRDRHIPGFLGVEGVELAAVANRSASRGSGLPIPSIFPPSMTTGATCWTTPPLTLCASAPGPTCTAT